MKPVQNYGEPFDPVSRIGWTCLFILDTFILSFISLLFVGMELWAPDINPLEVSLSQ